MNKIFTKEFIQATLIRVIRTGAQTLLSMMTVGQAVMDINWLQALSVTITAMIIAVLTAIVTGLPEVGNDGKFIIDDSDPDVTKWTLQYNGDPEKLKAGDSVTFIVKEGEQ